MNKIIIIFILVSLVFSCLNFDNSKKIEEKTICNKVFLNDSIEYLLDNKNIKLINCDDLYNIFKYDSIKVFSPYTKPSSIYETIKCRFLKNDVDFLNDDNFCAVIYFTNTKSYYSFINRSYVELIKKCDAVKVIPK